jgi:hypothetical protein
MKTTTDNKAKVTAFLTKNPKSDAKAIEKATGIKRSEVFAVIGELGKQIDTFQKGAKSVKLFSVVMPSVEKAKAAKAAKAAEVEKTAKTDKSEGKNFGRDFSKYQFNGQEFRKGKLVLAVVKFIAEKQGCSFKKLLEIFPSELVRNYGVFTEASTARKMNASGKQRYFCQADQFIKLKDGSVVAVTNQISSNNIDPILEIARQNGCKIVAVRP